MNTFYDILQETSLSRLWDKTQKYTCGVITGFRGDKTKAENLKRNHEIVAFLQGRGYSVTKVLGTYIEHFGTDDATEVSEQSFFVANHAVDGDDNGMLKKDLAMLGQRYDQDSILVIPFGGKGAYLYGTSHRDNAYPPFGQTAKVGDATWGDAAGEFLSKVQGRKFAFENIEPPQTINGIRGQKILVMKLVMEEKGG